MYEWNSIQVYKTELAGVPYYKLQIRSNPIVKNRRKYPRMAMRNYCGFNVGSGTRDYLGMMVNISAGGFAFESKEEILADAIGEQVRINIRNFELESESQLEGVIIRVTDNDGKYIVGCRMPSDNMVIKDYVEEKMG